MLSCGVEVRGFGLAELDAALFAQAGGWLLNDLLHLVSLYADSSAWRMASMPERSDMEPPNVSLRKHQAIEMTLANPLFLSTDHHSLVPGWQTTSPAFRGFFGRSLEPPAPSGMVGAWPTDLSPGLTWLLLQDKHFNLTLAVPLRDLDPTPLPRWCITFRSSYGEFEQFCEWFRTVRQLQAALYARAGAPDSLIRIVFWTSP